MGVGSLIGGAASLIGSMSASKKGAKTSRQAEEKLEMSEEQWEWGKERIEEWDALSQNFADAMSKLATEYGVFAQDIWSNWEGTFGDMRQNLVDYYNSLDPDKYSTMWKSEIESQMQKQFNQLDQSLAQTGIYTSGMRQQLQKEMAMQQAQQNAMADIQAPDYVAQMKNQFYGQYGQPERNQALGMRENVFNRQQNALMQGYNAQAQPLQSSVGFAGNAAQGYANLAQPYMQSAAGYGQQAGNMMGTGAGLISDFMGKNFSWW